MPFIIHRNAIFPIVVACYNSSKFRRKWLNLIDMACFNPCKACEGGPRFGYARIFDGRASKKN